MQDTLLSVILGRAVMLGGRRVRRRLPQARTSVGDAAGGPSLSHTKPAEPSVGEPSLTAPPSTATAETGGGFTDAGGSCCTGAAAGLLRGVAGRSGPPVKSAFVCRPRSTMWSGES